MDSVGRTAATAIGVACTPITGDHFSTGVGLQPGCEAVRLTVRQQVNDGTAFQVNDGTAFQVNDGTAFQVNEDRSVTLPSFPCPIIHPKHARRRSGRRRRATTDEAEQGGAAHGRADPLGQARAGLAAQRQANVVLEAAQTGCPLGIRPGNTGQALGEDALRAPGPAAAQPAHLHLDLHAAALPRQICQPAGVAAVQP